MTCTQIQVLPDRRRLDDDGGNETTSLHFLLEFEPNDGTNIGHEQINALENIPGVTISTYTNLTVSLTVVYLLPDSEAIIDHINSTASVIAIALGGDFEMQIVAPPSPSPPFPQSITPPPAGAEGVQDPHLRLAHGGKTDFRGRNDTLYNFISSPGFAMNVRVHLSDFWLHRRALLVHGSFMTQVHFNMRNMLNMTFDAARMNYLNYAWNMLTGVCGKQRFKVGPHGKYECSTVASVNAEYSSVTVRVDNWVIRVTAQPIYDRFQSDAVARSGFAFAGPHHRLDIRVTRSGSHTCHRTHGILGQSFVQMRRDGLLDTYPDAGVFTTQAMGEGAIDGVAADYEMNSPHAYRFKFSSFADAPCNGTQSAFGASYVQTAALSVARGVNGVSASADADVAEE